MTKIIARTVSNDEEFEKGPFARHKIGTFYIFLIRNRRGVVGALENRAVTQLNRSGSDLPSPKDPQRWRHAAVDLRYCLYALCACVPHCVY